MKNPADSDKNDLDRGFCSARADPLPAETGTIPESLLEEVPWFVSVIDRDFRILRANRAFREQFGDRVGDYCLVRHAGRDPACEDCPVNLTFLNGKPHQSQEVWTVNDRNRHVLVRTAPIHDSSGIVVQVLEMALDVTEFREWQIELERSREQYKYLFNHVPCYLTVLDRDYNLIQSNQTFNQDFGNRIGEKCYQVYKGRDSKCDDCPVEQTFQDGAIHTSEHLWYLSGGETHIIAAANPVRNDKGEIVAVMEMCTNITEVKKLQSELALLGETVAGMSHTVKNILSGLQGGVYVVDSGLERSREDRVREGWSMVKRNVEKISELVKGILYAAKERTPEKEFCDPADMLTDVCDLYQGKARSQGVALVREFGKSMGQVLVDKAALHSAVSNLVANAIDACRSSLAPNHRVSVAGSIENGTLRIQVSDNGIGMAQEVRERLFAKFYSTKGSRGTGLGLVITRKVVEEHSGTIHVESEPGKGSTFTLLIPAL